MNFELKVQAPQNAPVVWNYESLKADLTKALSDFSNRTYTEETIAEAKEDSAKLNKLKKAISDERISRKKEYMKPFETFEDQAKELCELIDEAASSIKSQLDAFEQKRIDEKTKRIEALYADIISNYDLPFITLDKILNDKWFNKSVSEKDICKEITEICEKAIKDLEVIKHLQYAVETEIYYKQTLDLNSAIEKSSSHAEVEKAKADGIKVTSAESETFEISFKAKMTVEQAKALKKFCDDNGIKLEQI